MYPAEIEIKDTRESKSNTSFIDLPLSMGRDGQLRTNFYGKFDYFKNCIIPNYLFIIRIITSYPAIIVFIRSKYVIPWLAPIMIVF